MSPSRSLSPWTPTLDGPADRGEPDVTDKLDDTWTSRDFPVLVAAARLLEQGQTFIRADDVCIAAGLTPEDATRAIEALIPAYLEWVPPEGAQSGIRRVLFTGRHRLTERGRRAVGLWPSGESVDALVDALHQAEATTSDPEEKSAIRRAAGAVLSVGRDVMTDVMAAVIARQIGA